MVPVVRSGFEAAGGLSSTSSTHTQANDFGNVIRATFRKVSDKELSAKQAEKVEFLHKLEASMRACMSGHNDVMIEFVDKDFLHDSTLGEFAWSNESNTGRISVAIGHDFNPRNKEDVFRVAQTAFHEVMHERQQALASYDTAEASPIQKDVILNLMASQDGDTYRYKRGYSMQPIEFDAERGAARLATEFCVEHFGEKARPRLEKICLRSYKDAHPSWEGLDKIVSGDIVSQIEDVAQSGLETACSYRPPFPCRAGEVVADYMSKYAPDEFVMAWRNATNDVDRDRLACAAESALAIGGIFPRRFNPRSEFGWLMLDWDLSSGGNAMNLTGVFDDHGVTLRTWGPDDCLTPLDKPRDEISWCSKSDVEDILSDALGKGLVLGSQRTRGLRVDAQGVHFPKGATRSLTESGVFDAVMDWVADGKLTIDERRSKAGSMPDVVRQWADQQSAIIHAFDGITPNARGSEKTPISTGLASDAQQSDFSLG